MFAWLRVGPGHFVLKATDPGGPMMHVREDADGWWRVTADDGDTMVDLPGAWRSLDRAHAAAAEHALPARSSGSAA